MLSTVLFRLVISFTVLGAVALPAVATAQVAWQDICEQWIENHPHDPAWAQRCVEWMYFWELSHPERYLHAPDPPKRRVFPYDRTWIPAGTVNSDLQPFKQAITSEGSVDVIVQVDAADLRNDIHTRALNEGLFKLSPALRAEKAAGLALLKAQALDGNANVVLLEDFPDLSSMVVRVLSIPGLNELNAQPEVRAIFDAYARYETFLGQSLNVIHHPDVVAEGQLGSGTTVAVLDTGVNWMEPPFSCAAPGGTCQVEMTAELSTDENGMIVDDGSLDDTGHGTNVSAIAASVASEAQLIVADIFQVVQTGNGPRNVALDRDIRRGLQWAIDMQDALNVVAVNMSLGTGGFHEQHCTGDDGPLSADLAEALSMGIQPIVASGNDASTVARNTFMDGISHPACAPAAVSVGITYDDTYLGGGGVTWTANGNTICSDSGVVDDPVCWGQTAPILHFLAPGSFISAGGGTGGTRSGTSMAAPHVAGAWAIASAQTPGARPTFEFLQHIGVPRTDIRPNPDRTTPRIDLLPEPGSTTLLVFGALGVVALGRWRRRS